MNPKKLFRLLVFSSILTACTNENPDTLGDKMDNPNSITYNQNVKSIIDNNCIRCHAATPLNGAPMSLVTYNQVKEAIQNRGLLNRISFNNGNTSLMPQGGPRLPQATIDAIVKWKEDGLLEN